MRKLANALGWFSIALGAAEVLGPKRLNRALGVDSRGGLTRAYGLREIGAGLGLLAAKNKRPWLWSRVAGDALDLATLNAAAKKSGRKGRVGAAAASVLAVTALDLLAARRR
jgi:hypothetical protein